MKTSKYFYEEASGLNADIKRHMKEEKELRESIDNADSEYYRKAYQYLLNELLVSKAKVLEKLGNACESFASYYA